MRLKNWPYWLKGGIIGGIIGIVYFLIFLVAYFSDLWVFKIISLPVSIIRLMSILTIMPLTAQFTGCEWLYYIDRCPLESFLSFLIPLPIVSLICFLIGAFIGWVYDKYKLKNRGRCKK